MRDIGDPPSHSFSLEVHQNGRYSQYHTHQPTPYQTAHSLSSSSTTMPLNSQRISQFAVFMPLANQQFVPNPCLPTNSSIPSFHGSPYSGHPGSIVILHGAQGSVSPSREAESHHTYNNQLWGEPHRAGLSSWGIKRSKVCMGILPLEMEMLTTNSSGQETGGGSTTAVERPEANPSSTTPEGSLETQKYTFGAYDPLAKPTTSRRKRKHDTEPGEPSCIMFNLLSMFFSVSVLVDSPGNSNISSTTSEADAQRRASLLPVTSPASPSTSTSSSLCKPRRKARRPRQPMVIQEKMSSHWVMEVDIRSGSRSDVLRAKLISKICQGDGRGRKAKDLHTWDRQSRLTESWKAMGWNHSWQWMSNSKIMIKLISRQSTPCEHHITWDVGIITILSSTWSHRGQRCHSYTILGWPWLDAADTSCARFDYCPPFRGPVKNIDR